MWGTPMSVYRPVSTRIVTSEFKPADRRDLIRLLNLYDLIAGLLALVILGLVVAPIARHYPLYALWPLCYGLYLAGKLAIMWWLRDRERDTNRAVDLLPVGVRHWIATHTTGLGLRAATWVRRLTTRQALEFLQLGFALVLTLAAFVFCIMVRRANTVLGLPQRDADSIWLLFAVPILRSARYGSQRWFVGITLLALMLNAMTHLVGEPLTTVQAVRLIGLESAWLVLICLLPALLARYLAVRHAGLDAAARVAAEISRLRTSSQRDFANQACAAIAKTFGYDEVNILAPTSEDEATGKGLRFVGAATDAGRALVNEVYTLDHAKGVNGHTALYLSGHLVNDVQRDPLGLYFLHPSFPDTCSELSVPLLIGEQTLVGVLDIQSRRPYAFCEDDVEALQAIVPHLAVALDNTQNLAHAQGLSRISRTVAQRLLSHEELRGVLHGVVEGAREVLGADVVVLYPHNPRDSSFQDAVVAGDLRTHVAPARSLGVGQRESTVRGAISLREPQFLSHAWGDGGAANPRDGSTTRKGFVHREEIVSTVVLPLRLGGESESERGDTSATTLGVIFVNYRKKHLFTSEYRIWCEALAALAALTVQSALLHQRVSNEERANMWREIHDGMAQYAGLTRMLLEQLGSEFERRGAVDSEKLLMARDTSQALQRQVNYLIEVWRDYDPDERWRRDEAVAIPEDTGAFFSELKRYREIVERTLEVQCSCLLQGTSGRVSAPIQHDARMIIREAVHNAVRHGRARVIDITVQVSDEALMLCVADNGKGFDSHRTATAHGLRNMRFRAARHDGTVAFESIIGRGTIVSATMPLRRTPAINEASA